MEKRMTIEEARAVINQQDEKILEAFGKRMAAAREIARNKEEQGLTIYIPEREQEILQRMHDRAPDGLADYAVALYEKLMELSRQYQREGKKYGLLGRKLGHSFSPEIHRMLGTWSEAYDYGIFQVEPENLEEFILHGDWAGLNVTIPYKEMVMAWCDEISPEATRIGAVNTLVRRQGKIYGYNTDYTGFRKTVEESHATVDGAKCIVLGSGGASKTVVAVLKDLGASEVVVVSRDGKTGCDYAGISSHYDARILVNTTPVGMYPDTGKSAVYPGTFPKLEWVFDVIYNPLRTNLLCQAKRSDMQVFNGLKMLVAQARASAELFLGREIPKEALEEIFSWNNKENGDTYRFYLVRMENCHVSGLNWQGDTNVFQLRTYQEDLENASEDVIRENQCRYEVSHLVRMEEGRFRAFVEGLLDIQHIGDKEERKAQAARLLIEQDIAWNATVKSVNNWYGSHTATAFRKYVSR